MPVNRNKQTGAGVVQKLAGKSPCRCAYGHPPLPPLCVCVQVDLPNAALTGELFWSS